MGVDASVLWRAAERLHWLGTGRWDDINSMKWKKGELNASQRIIAPGGSGNFAVAWKSRPRL
jgi:hypothetical protein